MAAAHTTKNTQNIAVAPKAFCDLPPVVSRELEAVTLTNTYPTGAVLFAEAQAPRGVFAVLRGRVKLSVCASDGRTLILRLADAGEILGVAAAVSGREYEATAETQKPCEISFMRGSRSSISSSRTAQPWSFPTALPWSPLSQHRGGRTSFLSPEGNPRVPADDGLSHHQLEGKTAQGTGSGTRASVCLPRTWLCNPSPMR